jgi:hypothetical protein
MSEMLSDPKRWWEAHKPANCVEGCQLLDAEKGCLAQQIVFCSCAGAAVREKK